MNVTAPAWISEWEIDTTDGLGYGAVKLAKYLVQGDETKAIMAFDEFYDIPYTDNLGILWEDGYSATDQYDDLVPLWGKPTENEIPQIYTQCDGVNNLMYDWSDEWDTKPLEDWFLNAFPQLNGYELVFIAAVSQIFPDLPDNLETIDKRRWEAFFHMCAWSAFCQNMAEGVI